MKLIKRIGVLLSLSACLFLIENDHITEAQASCPERDQCLDAAYSNYSSQITAANQVYFGCSSDAETTRNSCLSDAEQTKSSCRTEADWEFELNLGRCSVISDPYLHDYCMQELENARQQTYSACEYEYDLLVDACWWGFSSQIQQCDLEFLDSANRAQQLLALESSGCDTLCF